MQSSNIKSTGALTRKFAAAALAAGLGACSTLPDIRNDNHPVLKQPEQIVEMVCASPRPLLIIDTFNRHIPDMGTKIPQMKYFDADGDSVNDVSHGDMTYTIATLSGKQVLTYGIRMKNDREYVYGEDVTEAFLNIATAIENGVIPAPSAILLSITSAENIDMINLNLAELSLQKNPDGFTPDTIDSIDEESADALINLRDNDDPLRQAYSAYKALRDKGIPLITAAGNDGAEYKINMYSLFGATTVGALTHDKNGAAPYNNNNSLVKIWRKGDFISRKTDDGIDINDDGITDIPSAYLSNGPSVASQLNGQSVLFYNGHNNAMLTVNHKFYGLEDTANLMSARGYPRETAESFSRTYGEINYPELGMSFRLTGGEALRFDPDGSGDPSQVNIFSGTSAAVPNICG